jgi:hypothetical protein
MVLFNYVDNGDGICENAGDRIFKTSFLAVSCDGGTNYIVDDYYVECSLGSIAHGLEPDLEVPTNRISCIQGKWCEVDSCSLPLNFVDMFVSSTPDQFDASCIESLNGLPVTLAPTATPVVQGYPGYQATFQAAWGLLSQGEATDLCASNEFPTVRIQCLKGGTIDFVESESETISCAETDESTLECTNAESIMNSFPLVTYVSHC